MSSRKEQKERKKRRKKGVPFFPFSFFSSSSFLLFGHVHRLSVLFPVPFTPHRHSNTKYTHTHTHTYKEREEDRTAYVKCVFVMNDRTMTRHRLRRRQNGHKMTRHTNHHIGPFVRTKRSNSRAPHFQTLFFFKQQLDEFFFSSSFSPPLSFFFFYFLKGGSSSERRAAHHRDERSQAIH